MLFVLIGSLGLYTLFILFFLTGLRRIETHSEYPSTFPSVAVVVAARNEEKNLPGLLEDFSKLDYPSDKLDIVIADDRSTDDTWSVISDYSTRFSFIRGVKIRDKAKTLNSKKYALTQAINGSKGDYILTTDADCRVNPDWVKSMVMLLLKTNGIIVGPSIIDSPNKNAFSSYQQLDFLALMAANAGAMGWGFSWTGSGQNLGYTRNAFVTIDGFNPVQNSLVGDDHYLVQAISKLTNGTFNIQLQSLVKTKPLDTLGEFINQRIRWSSYSRFAMKTNPFFLIFLLTAFFVNTSLFIGLFSPSVLTFIPMAFGIKFIGEAMVLYSWTILFHLPFPTFIYIIWSFLQPIYVPFVGLAGLTGRFTWKP